ncbi:MAG TPA: TMEM165/GDT1 family protein [Limnochordia bacterium]|nr:TMEM165/GDT1 family protein [Limnochordia bacterium]
MLYELGRASLLIFLAELGDKTQILAMAFALQYSVGQVLLGVAAGALLNHGVAVLIGAYLANVIPLAAIRLGSALLFLAFGLWSLWSEEEHINGGQKALGSPVLVVALAFFLGELGDKTQLTAIALASSSAFPAAVLAGTVLGMVLTSLGGIYVGTKLGDRIPELALKLISSFVFIGFGTFHLIQTVPDRFVTPGNLLLYAVVLGAAVWPRLAALRRRRAADSGSGELQRMARQLQALDRLLSEICLGDEKCRAERCPVGYCKQLVRAELNGSKAARRRPVVQPYVRQGQNFDRRKLEQALSLLEASGLPPELYGELKGNLEKLLRPL